MTSVSAPPNRGTSRDWLRVWENSDVPLLSLTKTAMAGGALHGNTVNPVDSPKAVQVRESHATLVRQVGLDDVILDRAAQVVATSGGDVGGATEGSRSEVNKSFVCG